MLHLGWDISAHSQEDARLSGNSTACNRGKSYLNGILTLHALGRQQSHGANIIGQPWDRVFMAEGVFPILFMPEAALVSVLSRG